MSNTKKMGVMQLTIITAVNMMGSGIIMLPTKLAKVGTISILSWIVTAGGSLCLAYCFALCGMYSRKKGGMGGYAEETGGKNANFIANYTYAFSLILANVAIGVSAVGYGVVFLKWVGVLDMSFALSGVVTGIATIALLWVTTIANFGGSRITGRIGSFTVWGVIVPVVGISVIGWLWFSPSLYVSSWNVNDLPFSEAVTTSITMTLWSFLGLESACANSDAVENPERDVPIAVMGGTLGAAIVYIASTNVMAGILPANVLANSTAPFGEVFAYIMGGAVGTTVTGLMAVACLGSLLGWQFTTAQVLKSSADVGYFPKVFGEENSMGAPVKGMIIMTVIETILAFFTMDDKLAEQFFAIVDLAVVTNLVPYVLSMAALPLLLSRKRISGGKRTMILVINFLATAYSFYALYASGLEALAYGSMITFAGWIIYGYVAHRFDDEKAAA